MKQWKEDGKGNPNIRPRDCKKFSALAPDIQAAVTARLPTELRATLESAAKTAAVESTTTPHQADLWVHDFLTCEIRGRKRFETLRKAPSGDAEARDRASKTFSTEYKVFDVPEEDDVAGGIRTHYQGVSPDKSHHDVVIKPAEETLEVWMTLGGLAVEPLTASEVLYQIFTRQAKGARLLHFSHRNVNSGTGTAVYGHLEATGKFSGGKIHVQAPSGANGTSESDRIFYAYLGTDNGSTAFGLLLDHRGDLDVRGLASIEADAGTITFHLASA